MRRILAGLLALSCALGMVGSAWAVKWLSDGSYRVKTIGNATLGIEDETTALTPFNHENPAGVVLNEKMNRIDLGLSYSSLLIDTPSTTFSPAQKTTITDLELTRPGGEYRGLTYWVTDALAFRVGIEGMVISSVDSTTGSPDQKLNFSGLGGGGSVAYKFDFGLALGAGFEYVGAGGKQDPLPANTTKADVTASNLDWGVGAAYVIDKMGGDNKLSLGLSVGSDDDRPSLSGAAGGSFADYNGLIDAAGTFPGGTFTQKETTTNTPLKISGEAIFDLGKMLSAGLLFDSKSRETKYKLEQTNSLGGSVTSEYKTQVSNIMGISPVVRANIPLAEGLNLLPGLMYTTYGSGTIDNYRANGLNTSYKFSSTTNTSGMFAVGLGLQALNKALQIAAQAGAGSTRSESKNYDVNGTLLGTSPAQDTNLSTMGVGAEYWIIPMLAVRLGYATNTTTYKAIAPATDTKSTVNSLTFGAGFASLNGMTVDLLVKLDTYTQDPEPNPKTTETGTGVFIGTRIPL